MSAGLPVERVEPNAIDDVGGNLGRPADLLIVGGFNFEKATKSADARPKAG